MKHTVEILTSCIADALNVDVHGKAFALMMIPVTSRVEARCVAKYVTHLLLAGDPGLATHDWDKPYRSMNDMGELVEITCETPVMDETSELLYGVTKY